MLVVEKSEGLDLFAKFVSHMKLSSWRQCPQPIAYPSHESHESLSFLSPESSQGNYGNERSIAAQIG